MTEPTNDGDRCASTHWSLPVQCVLKSSHRENWHETWDPESGNRLRYRHPGGRTEELRAGEWVALDFPKPDLRSRDELLAEVERLTAAPMCVWTYNDDEGETSSEPYATEAGARADAEEEYVDNAYTDPAYAGVLSWAPLPQNADCQLLLENGQSVGVHLWRSKVIGAPSQPVALPTAWTDPTHGTVYDLTKAYLAEEESYFHHVGWIDLDDPVPLMGWSGSPDGRTASRNWEDISTLAALIADFGPLTPVEPTTPEGIAP